MTIKEVAAKTDISKDTLRYYEKEMLIGPIKKENGIRKYDDNDIARISFVKCMRSAGVPIDVLRSYMQLYDEGKDTAIERKKLLEEQRDILGIKIKDMQEAYDRLSYKIANL